MAFETKINMTPLDIAQKKGYEDIVIFLQNYFKSNSLLLI